MNVVVKNLHLTGWDSGGDKPVALLLHGWGRDFTSLNKLMPLFGDYRIIAPNLPGFGGSQPPPKAFSVDDYADVVSAMLSKLGIDEVSLALGHSFGGRILLNLAGKDKLRIGKMILVGSHGLKEKLTPAAAGLLLAAKASRMLPRVLRERLIQKYGSDDYKNSNGVMRLTFRKVIRQDASRYAANIACPVLLIYGRDDQITPPELGRRLKDLIPKARLEVVKEAGHYPFEDNFQAVAEQIRSFI